MRCRVTLTHKQLKSQPHCIWNWKQTPNNNYYNTVPSLTKRYFNTNTMNIEGAKRIQGFGGNIWTELTDLANKHEAVNLGQGFPDFEAPKWIHDAASKRIYEGPNQYSRATGEPVLVNSLIDLYSKKPFPTHKNETFDYSFHKDSGFPSKLNSNEILITNGASGGLYTALQAFISDGDAVVLFEPFFDIYTKQVLLAGGKPSYTPLRWDDTNNGKKEWRLHEQDLKNAITSKTKAIILNTPHNPSGKIFEKEELEMIADFAKKHNLLVLSDEVYEFLQYNKPHHRIANIPGMWERTLTFGSAGKTLCVTGWKVGWIVGHSDLVQKCLTVQQFLVFCVNAPLQRAVGDALSEAKEPKFGDNNDLTFYEHQRLQYASKRDYLCSVLKKCGFDPSPSQESLSPDGGLFVIGDISKVDFPQENNGEARDYQFCKWLTKEVGVAAIPPSVFYCKEDRNLGENYVRFCFWKTDQVLHRAAEKLLNKFA
eukprot:gb/GECH01002921.1/.p1 GENE.gb/GECH01002921.1/~~gb/GECH01002921.1/.p1  ORF type:complete len:482 (+),score=120.26 gb/GECH01002921.1/:1-1446(+)